MRTLGVHIARSRMPSSDSRRHEGRNGQTDGGSSSNNNNNMGTAFAAADVASTRSQSQNSFSDRVLSVLERARYPIGVIGLAIGGASLGALIGYIKYKRIDRPNAASKSMDRLVSASHHLAASSQSSDSGGSSSAPPIPAAALAALVPERWSRIRSDVDACELMVRLGECAPYAADEYATLGDALENLLECVHKASELRHCGASADPFIDYRAYQLRRTIVDSCNTLVEKAIALRNDLSLGISPPVRRGRRGGSLRSQYNRPDPPNVNVESQRAARRLMSLRAHALYQYVQRACSAYLDAESASYSENKNSEDEDDSDDGGDDGDDYDNDDDNNNDGNDNGNDNEIKGSNDRSNRNENDDVANRVKEDTLEENHNSNRYFNSVYENYDSDESCQHHQSRDYQHCDYDCSDRNDTGDPGSTNATNYTDDASDYEPAYASADECGCMSDNERSDYMSGDE